MTDRFSFLIHIVDIHLDDRMDINFLFIVCDGSLFAIVENQAFALGFLTQLGDVIQSQDHILRRHGDRSTIGRVQDIV